MAMEGMKCPQCGADTIQEEIDIGVGSLKRPPFCPICYWSQEDELPEELRWKTKE